MVSEKMRPTLKKAATVPAFTAVKAILIASYAAQERNPIINPAQI
jgi:hypothetical protein